MGTGGSQIESVEDSEDEVQQTQFDYLMMTNKYSITKEWFIKTLISHRCVTVSVILYQVVLIRTQCLQRFRGEIKCAHLP